MGCLTGLHMTQIETVQMTGGMDTGDLTFGRETEELNIAQLQKYFYGQRVLIDLDSSRLYIWDTSRRCWNENKGE